MTNYYIASTGDNSDGLTWAKAFTTFASAVTAATGDGDNIYVDQGFTDALTANTTYSFGNNVRVICSNDKVNEPPQTLGSMGTSNWIGSSSVAANVVLNGAYKVFFYGITLRTAGATGFFSINSSDGGHFVFENCYFWEPSTGTLKIVISHSENGYTDLYNCVFRFGSTSQGLGCNAIVNFYGCSISGDGSTPATLFATLPGAKISSFGCDWSLPGTSLIASQGTAAQEFNFYGCKINASLSSVLTTQSPANKSSAHAWLFDCSGDDTHYHLQHHDAFGSTIIDTGIYANDGAQYDGTNRCSWKIFTSANCSYHTPYVSPWIDCYHSGTSAITPSLEIVRSGSATAYQDDEVWAEFSYQGTSGSPLATIVSDRKALLAAAADQTTGALDASGWTGENATSWFGKLNPTATITPAEIGHLRARVVVGEPSITVYVDPTIRGRS